VKNQEVGVIFKGIISVPNLVKKAIWFKSLKSVAETIKHRQYGDPWRMISVFKNERSIKL
jgi:hypothetical protein